MHKITNNLWGKKARPQRSKTASIKQDIKYW